MKRMLSVLPGALLAGVLVLGGCGKQDEQPTRFNQTLGETPVGAPVATHSLDAGILKDPTAYKPAAYEPLEPRPAGGEAGGPEAQAIHTVVNNLIAGIFDGFDIETILDCFAPEQVAALKEDEFLSAAHELNDTVAALIAVLKDKGTGPDFEQAWEFLDMLSGLAEPLTNTVTVAVLDEENAVATIDVGKLEMPEELESILASLAETVSSVASMMGASPGEEAPAGTPAAPTIPGMPTLPPGAIPSEMLSSEALLEGIKTAQIPIPFRKIEEGWKVSLPSPVPEEAAGLVAELLEILKDIAADATQQIDQVETLDAPTFGQILVRASTLQTGALMGWAGRAQMMAAAEAAEEPADEVEEPSDPNEADEPNAPAAPPGRGRRPRGP